MHLKVIFFTLAAVHAAISYCADNPPCDNNLVQDINGKLSNHKILSLERSENGEEKKLAIHFEGMSVVCHDKHGCSFILCLAYRNASADYCRLPEYFNSLWDSDICLRKTLNERLRNEIAEVQKYKKENKQEVRSYSLRAIFRKRKVQSPLDNTTM